MKIFIGTERLKSCKLLLDIYCSLASALMYVVQCVQNADKESLVCLYYSSFIAESLQCHIEMGKMESSGSQGFKGHKFL